MSAQVQETTSGRAEVAGDRRFAEPWRPPARSIATRFPSRRSRGSGRRRWSAARRRAGIRCESDLEHKALRVLLAGATSPPCRNNRARSHSSTRTSA